MVGYFNIATIVSHSFEITDITNNLVICLVSIGNVMDPDYIVKTLKCARYSSSIAMIPKLLNVLGKISKCENHLDWASFNALSANALSKFSQALASIFESTKMVFHY